MELLRHHVLEYPGINGNKGFAIQGFVLSVKALNFKLGHVESF